MKTTDIIALIEAAVAHWTGADWTHEYRIDGQAQHDEDCGGYPEVSYCYGGRPGCSTCAKAEADASEAAALASEAVEELKCGDLAEALRLAEAARDLEADYGDAVVWRPVVEAIEAAIADGEAEDEAAAAVTATEEALAAARGAYKAACEAVDMCRLRHPEDLGGALDELHAALDHLERVESALDD